MKGILGRKIGMTEVFAKNGKLTPVTVILVEPNVITQVKTMETDGYNALQLSVTDKKEKSSNKAAMGHTQKAGTTPKRFLKEIRNVEGQYTLGDTLTADIFEAGEYVDVTGTSKGKGTQGVIKRHGQSEGPKTHGSRYHRRPGSMGTMRPMRVMKGKHLAGRMGGETTTIQNLEIIDVNSKENYILVSGNIPGAKNSLVLIKTSVKMPGKKNKNVLELIDYEPVVEETIADEVVEDTTETTENIQEVIEETTESVETTEEVKEETKEVAE